VTETSMNPSDHPAALTLASLARGELEDNERETCALHLAHCRRCMAIYAEFVEQALGEGQERVPPGWLDQALTIPEPGRGSAPPRPRPLKWAWGVALLCIMGLALLVFTKAHRPESIPNALEAALLPGLRADSQGSLVYGDNVAPEPRGVRGNANGDASASNLERLLEIYRSHPSDAEVAYWVVSTYLATNQLRNADPFLREALERFPNDARFLNLAAILAYKENRLADAERNLRNAAAKERNATVLVNLAMVRRQQGDENEAEALLSEAQSRFPDSALSPYIRELARAAH
jgi:tetratricopeptide repeat protein